MISLPQMIPENMTQYQINVTMQHNDSEEINSKKDSEKSMFLNLQLDKIQMYEFLHDRIKEKYDDKAHLCHMDTDSFIINTF